MPFPTKSKGKRAMTSDLPPLSEAELIRDLDEDLQDAWSKLRDFLNDLGPQRTYTSARAIMFARDRCYAFVRPQKKYLQLNFFLDELIDSPQIKRGNRVSENRAANVFKLVHADQIDEPLTDWLREAWEFADPERTAKLNLRVGPAARTPKSGKSAAARSSR